MTTLDHARYRPHLRAVLWCCPLDLGTELRVRPDCAVGRLGLAVDERWIQGPPRTGDRPATASAPGISSRRSVAEGLKSAPTLAWPRQSGLRSAPADSVADRLKPFPTGTRVRLSGLGPLSRSSVVDWENGDRTPRIAAEERRGIGDARVEAQSGASGANPLPR
ncbi:hypothetical protein GCM10010403_37050 [Glycomyces rutgersensis]|uniref:Uncharacterized protein n=1 Tax=Glycomyces rutgersensis TaxID=58115 RepID=A0ABN3FZ36_9ACTN